MKCRKQIRKLISFLAIVCCLAGSAAPALPADAASAGDGAVVFTNEPKNSADLYVTKTVENADPERAADLFQFVLLKPNGQKADPVGERTYRLYQLDGNGGIREIVKKDKVGNVISYETDSSGVFTLGAGQRACFENLGAGVRYEVQELNAYLSPRGTDGELRPVSGDSRDYYAVYYKDSGEMLYGGYTYRPVSLEQGNYRKVQPVGGTTGACTMPENGDMVDFTNSYEGGGSGSTANLTVSKTAVWPTNWTAPKLEDDFWFRVEIDRGYGLEAYGGREYTLTDPAQSGTSVHRTAADGTFSLKAGCSAVFTEIPVGSDYQVCEIVKGTRANPDNPDGDPLPVTLPAGWKAVGTVTETEGGNVRTVIRPGALGTGGNTVNFINSNFSFVVTKKLNDNGKPDVDFAFRLADAGRNGMKGRSYYLYKTTGEPVYYEELTEAEKADGSGNSQGPEVQEDRTEGTVDDQGVWHRRHLIVRTTGEDGAFTLKAGQAAVFTGMEAGTSYRVVETGTPSYVQMLPLPEDDGKVYSVNPDTIQMLDFTNKKVEQAGNLTVLKQVQNESGEGSLNTEEEFHFILYQRLKTAEDFQKLKVLNAAPTNEADANTAVENGLTGGTLIRSVEAISGDGETTQNGDAWKTDYSYTLGNKEYAVYAPVHNAYYTMPDGVLSGGQSAPNDETGPKGTLGAGEFTLKAGKTACFSRLSAGSEYLVREVGLTSEYTEVTEGNTSYREIVVTESDTADPASDMGQSAVLTADGAALTFVNRFTPEKADLTITKTDAENHPLAGAEFMLYLEKGRDQANKFLPADLQGATPETFCWKTGTDGTVQINDLKLGTYWLYETKAPSGYCVLKEPVEIQVTRGKDNVLQVTVDGSAVTTVNNWQGSSSTPVGSASATDRTAENEKAQISITVINTVFYELPNSGGMGIYWYLISGMLLMVAAVLISYKYQRRGRC